MLGEKMSRALKPDAQAFDEIRVRTVPRYKQSGLSGDEWRISAVIEFCRNGKVVHTAHSSSIEYAAYLMAAHHIEACESGRGYFAGEDDACDQEGCTAKATIKAVKKFDYCRDGHKSERPSNQYRLFCDRHSTRGDSSFDDRDDNYDKTILNG